MTLSDKLSEHGIMIPEDLESYIKRYIFRRCEDMYTMKDLLAQEDFDGISEIAHNIKGSGAGFGFMSFTELATEIDAAAKSKNINLLKDYLSKLENEVFEVEHIINDDEESRHNE